MTDDQKIGTTILILSLILLGIVFYINVNQSLNFLSDPLYGEGLGNLCSSEEDCRVFCSTNRGRCDVYCQTNPENTLCEKLFGVVR